VSRKIRDGNGKYMRIKGHAVMAVEMYRGWEIHRIPGGPGQDVDQPTFKGVLRSRRLPGYDIETRTQPAIVYVKKAIDAFCESEHGEDEQKVILHA